MAAANSSLVRLYIGTTPVAVGCQTNTSWSASRDMVDTACKDGNGFYSGRPGLKNAELSAEGIVQTPAATGDPAALYTALKAGTLLTVEVSSTEAGVTEISGTGYVTSYSQEASGVEGLVTYSATVKLVDTFT